MDKEKVVLVDKKDVQLGLMPKLEAHRKGVLHRAFSIFIFNSSRMLLMQKRSSQKYHSPGLWTNTCCSHQRDGESTIDAASRRLNEEMGLIVDMKEVFSFVYKANLNKSPPEDRKSCSPSNNSFLKLSHTACVIAIFIYLRGQLI